MGAISGIRSAQHWLTCFAGVSPVTAHTPVGYDEDVVELAVHATVPQLRRALINYDVTEPATTQGPDSTPVASDLLSVAAQPAELTMYFDHDRST